MTRLILTTSVPGAGGLKFARIADIVLDLDYRFVWGRWPSEIAPWQTRRPTPEEQAAFLPPGPGTPRAWNTYRRHFGEIDRDEIGLIDFCEQCETIDLWIDPLPNAQLTLIWLLDYLRYHEGIASKLTLLQADVFIGEQELGELAKWRLPRIKITDEHLRLASEALQAYRAPTPQAWLGLLSKDLSSLPWLRRTVLELLEELPWLATALGATEMRMLEFISNGHVNPEEFFPLCVQPNRVFDFYESASLLERLARCPGPAVSGIDDGPFEEVHSDRSRRNRYYQNRFSLTALGKAILARADDFSRHNPIDRWWGGTHLTNDNLWRWDPAKQVLIAP
jgi:hypothetical protein